MNSDKLILVANGHATEFNGSVDDYPKWLAEHNRGGDSNAVSAESVEKKTQNSASAKKEQKRIDAERRKQLQPLTSKIKRAERVMEKLSVDKQSIEEQLSDNDLYSDENKEKLKQLLSDQAYIQKELDQAEADWLDATEQHEDLSEQLKASA